MGGGGEGGKRNLTVSFQGPRSELNFPSCHQANIGEHISSRTHRWRISIGKPWGRVAGPRAHCSLGSCVSSRTEDNISPSCKHGRRSGAPYGMAMWHLVSIPTHGVSRKQALQSNVQLLAAQQGATSQAVQDRKQTLHAFCPSHDLSAILF